MLSVKHGLFKNQYPYEVTQHYKDRVKEVKSLAFKEQKFEKLLSTVTLSSTIYNCHAGGEWQNDRDQIKENKSKEYLEKDTTFHRKLLR